MCLLIAHPIDTAFDEDDILDFFSKNRDGIGVMWAATDNNVPTLYTRKLLPTTGEDAVEFYKTHCKGRECVIHFRMQTHGHIDLENCHPYFITRDTHPVALMHNGMLYTGNAADKTKSDTWHYINDFLAPLVTKYPTLFAEPEFVAMLGESISASNKFIMLDAYGEMAIVNEEEFVEYKGAKLSNTYAWTSSRGGYSAVKSYKSMYSGSYYDDEWPTYVPPTKTATTPYTPPPYKPALAATVQEPTDMDEWIEETLEAFEEVSNELYELVEYNDLKTMYERMGAGFAWGWLLDIQNSSSTLTQIIADVCEFAVLTTDQLNERLNQRKLAA